MCWRMNQRYCVYSLLLQGSDLSNFIDSDKSLPEMRPNYISVILLKEDLKKKKKLNFKKSVKVFKVL